MAKLKVSALNGEALDTRLLALDLSTDGTLAERAKRLQDWIASKKFGRSLLADCDVCNGSSLASWPECPFCGDREVSPEVAKVVAKADKPKADKPKADKPKADKPKADKSAAIVLADAEKKLDDAVARLVGIRRNAIGLQWDFCTELRQIFDEKLWLHRTGRDGKPRYKAWNAFVSQEIGISPAYSYQLMSVAGNFTREQLSELGVKKLVMMLRLPDAERSAGGEREVPRGNVSTPTPVSTPVPSDAVAGSRVDSPQKSEPTTVAVEPKVTVAIEFGRRRIPLYARPSERGDLVPAKRLSDEPYAHDVLINGVEVRYQVVSNTDGELVLVVEHRRSAR